MKYLRNVIYVLLLAALLITGVIPRLRRHDILGGFWQKLRGQLSRLRTNQPLVWFHAACVGEAILCRPVIDRMQALRPDMQYLLSVCSPEGAAVAQNEFPELTVIYAPYDFTWTVKRVLNHFAPSLLVIAENDFWPNLIAEAGTRNIPIAIFNSRMSKREQTEHRWNGWLIASALKSVNWWGVVGSEDATWIKKLLGADSPPVEVTGSLKLDGIVRDKEAPAIVKLRQQFGYAPGETVLVAGSTHAPEDEIILGVFRRLKEHWPDLRLLLVPRYVDRCTDIGRLVHTHNYSFKNLSSLPEDGIDRGDVLLVDTIGELRQIWGLADVAFVGGSLAEHGGQNMAEPASYGIPVCFGPHVFNFSELAEKLTSAGAAVTVNNADTLFEVLSNWLTFPEVASAVGAKGQDLIRQNRMSLETTVARLSALLSQT